MNFWRVLTFYILIFTFFIKTIIIVHRIEMSNKILKRIDNILNRITMYRLILYYLIFLLVAALTLGLFGVIDVSPYLLLFSMLFLLSICWIVNQIFSYFFGAPTNVESLYITALILALIITPAQSISSLIFLVWAAVWAMASKYIIAIRHKHIFNPAAFAVALTAVTISRSASWWVGTMWMAPFVLVGGLLIVKKIRRFDMVLSYFIAAFLTIFTFYIFKGGNLIVAAGKILFESPILFFAFVMLTEPLTTPPTRFVRVLYGALTGFLFAPQIHIGSFYSTPELSLIFGNVFSYVVSPKQKLLLKLDARVKAANNTYDFIFKSDERLSFKPGQYLEWTLPQENPDSRGNRRYFTIASSPTEDDVLIGVKFYDNPSSFKETLATMKVGDEIVASQLSGDFTMPRDQRKKLVFIAGGIGVTPFRSIVKYLLDRNEKRDIVLFYSNNVAQDIAYKEIFDMARIRLNIKTIYTLTDKTVPLPANWAGKRGFVDEKMIKEEVPDYHERIFYISGPNAMVKAFKEILSKMGIEQSKIKTDYFPGY